MNRLLTPSTDGYSWPRSASTATTAASRWWRGILRDAGYEVIYTGLFQTPDTVAAAAVDEDVDAIGLSMLSGAHMTLAPAVVEKVRARGADIPVVVGGIVPEADVATLRAAGVAGVLTPGASSEQVVAVVRDAIAAARRDGSAAVIDRVERLTNLLALLLETSRPLTLVEIAGELRGQYPEGEANRRAMFERDKAALRGIGVPIETAVRSGEDAGVSEYWIDRERYELADLALEPDETRALQTAFATIRSASGGEIAAGELALWKLGATSADAELPVVAHVPELSALPTLRDAAARRRTVTFRYHATPRHLDPFGVLLRNGFWYVIGREHEADQQRTYRVDRIEGDVAVTGADHAFERPVGFDPRDQLPSDAKRVGVGDAVVVDAVVRVSAARAAMIEREVGSEHVRRRHADGAVDVVVPCANVGAFETWVLGLTDHAEVLGPPEVRAALIGRLTALADGPRRVDESGRPRTARCRCPAEPPPGAPAVADGAPRGADRRGRRRVPDDPGRGDRRARAGVDVWAPAVRRRDDRHLRRRGHRVRGRPPPVHQAVATHGARGLRPARRRTSGDAAPGRRPRRPAGPRAGQARRGAR